MVGDAGLQRHHHVDRRLRDRRLMAPVDHGMREVEDEVDEARGAVGRRQQAVEQAAGLGADARQGGRRGEEGRQEGGAHRRGRYSLRAIASMVGRPRLTRREGVPFRRECLM